MTQREPEDVAGIVLIPTVSMLVNVYVSGFNRKRFVDGIVDHQVHAILIIKIFVAVEHDLIGNLETKYRGTSIILYDWNAYL